MNPNSSKGMIGRSSDLTSVNRISAIVDETDSSRIKRENSLDGAMDEADPRLFPDALSFLLYSLYCDSLQRLGLTETIHLPSRSILPGNDRTL